MPRRRNSAATTTFSLSPLPPPRICGDETAKLARFLGHQTDPRADQLAVLLGGPVGCAQRRLLDGENRRHIVQRSGADDHGHGESHGTGFEKISASECRM